MKCVLSKEACLSALECADMGLWWAGTVEGTEYWNAVYARLGFYAGELDKEALEEELKDGEEDQSRRT